MKTFNKDYHDAEIIGYVYQSKEQIIFDIQTYHNQSCPEWLIELFPSIEFYVDQKRHESFDFYYISSSVGLEAVIVCENQAA